MQRSESQRFLLGINYWPRTTAMAMWQRFDIGQIGEDFARIAALGLDVVRFFLMWESFQPDPSSADRRMLERLDDVLECAASHGLQTIPTLFCGHMSGVNWLPGWALDDRRPSGRFRTISSGSLSAHGAANFYTGPLLDAQRRFARVLGERAKEHPAVLAWDVGNEFSNLRAPDSPRAAAAWSEALTADLIETSGIAVTGGLHGEDLTEDRHIRPSAICAPWSFATMHGYPVYSTFARGADDAEVVPFLAALTRGFSQKTVLFSEFGNPACTAEGASATGCLDEERMATYAREVLERLHGRGSLGALWWCWADYVAELATVPPFDVATHELHFGIVRSDGSEKAVAKVLAAFARERRAVVASRDVAGVDEDPYYASLPPSTQAAYDRYLARHGTGKVRAP